MGSWSPAAGRGACLRARQRRSAAVSGARRPHGGALERRNTLFLGSRTIIQPILGSCHYPVFHARRTSQSAGEAPHGQSAGASPRGSLGDRALRAPLTHPPVPRPRCPCACCVCPCLSASAPVAWHSCVSPARVACARALSVRCVRRARSCGACLRCACSRRWCRRRRVRARARPTREGVCPDGPVREHELILWRDRRRTVTWSRPWSTNEFRLGKSREI